MTKLLLDMITIQHNRSTCQHISSIKKCKSIFSIILAKTSTRKVNISPKECKKCTPEHHILFYHPGNIRDGMVRIVISSCRIGRIKPIHDGTNAAICNGVRVIPKSPYSFIRAESDGWEGDVCRGFCIHIQFCRWDNLILWIVANQCCVQYVSVTCRDGVDLIS